jgi:hypothetical protein
VARRGAEALAQCSLASSGEQRHAQYLRCSPCAPHALALWLAAGAEASAELIVLTSRTGEVPSQG